MVIDKRGRYEEHPVHIELYLDFLLATGLLASPPDAPPDSLFEWYDGCILLDMLTEAGRAFTLAIYDEYLEVVDYADPEASTGWLAERWAAWQRGEPVSERARVLALIERGLAPTIARCGLQPVAGEPNAWTRPAPGGGQTGFWLVLADTYPSPVGGAFLLRVTGGNLHIERREHPAIPEHRLGCWIGQEGRDEMAALNARVSRKLPPRETWPQFSQELIVVRGPYTPRGEAWLRWSDDADLEAWIAFFEARLPRVLDGIDRHFA